MGLWRFVCHIPLGLAILELGDADEVGMSWSNSRPMQWEVLTFHCYWILQILECNMHHFHHDVLFGESMTGPVAKTYSDSHPRFFPLFSHIPRA